MQQKLDIEIIKDIFVIDSENIYESKLMQQCFDIVSVFVAAIDLKGNITLISRKGAEMLGLPSHEIIGRNFVENFIEQKYLTQTREQLNKVLDGANANPENTKYRIAEHKGRHRIIEAKNVIIRNKNNKMLGVLISGEDITDYIRHQHNLQQDLNLYRILTNNLPDINLFLFDSDLRFMIAEGDEMRNFELEGKHLAGTLVDDLPNETLRKIWIPFFNKALEGKEVFSEYRLNDAYYMIWVVPVKEQGDKPGTCLAITRNITDDKLKEQQFEAARNKAVEANKSKSDFLARVSHEIRTPLNAILGFTEQLGQTSLNPQQHEYLKIIDKSSEHLLSLINDILVISKIEAEQISFEETPFKLRHTVNYVKRSLENKAAEKNLSFSTRIDPKLERVLLGDAFRLRQILINFLSNAVKFTENGYVELKCFQVSESDSKIMVRFDVSDSGIGIKPEDIEQIFNQFQQAGTGVTQKYGGTGLGLTICKNLIEMQKGSLSVSSQPGMGSVFSFTIPYGISDEQDIPDESENHIDTEKLAGKKFLLVDDDSVNRLLGKTILEKFRCRFDIAHNGTDALGMLKTGKYDAVLLDIHMPDINGTEVARIIRSEMKDEETKIIAVTAAVMKDDVQRYLNVGINDFLVKPFKEVHLYHKICNVLKIQNTNYTPAAAEIVLKEEMREPLIDLSDLEKMTGNNMKNRLILFDNLIDNSESTVDIFNKYASDDDSSPIGEAAHKLLPSYRHIKANRVLPVLTKIKFEILEAGNHPDLSEDITECISGIKQVVAALKKEKRKIRKSV